jgi:parallel beta-helix repeat protein
MHLSQLVKLILLSTVLLSLTGCGGTNKPRNNDSINYEQTSTRLLSAYAGSDQVVHLTPSKRTILLDASRSEGDIVHYEWQIDGKETVVGKRRWYAITAGKHTITLIVKDSKGNTQSDKIIITAIQENTHLTVTNISAVESSIPSTTNKQIGAKTVQPTPLSKGTKFASPHGKGLGTSANDPMSLQQAIKELEKGDVLFLKGGTYKNWGDRLQINALKNTSQEEGVIIESYPGETAIIDGGFSGSQYGFIIENNYIKLRRLEIKNIPHTAILISNASYNTIEGCTIHHNRLVGIQMISSYDKDKDKYKNGYNIIRNNIIHHNSDAKYSDGSFNKGDNADGISVSSGINNKILNNTVFSNSDDGIDTWGGTNTEVAYNIAYDHGKGEKGNGNGIKLGSYYNSKAPHAGEGTYAHHNICYNNKRHGFDLSQGRKVKVYKNTAYQNGWKGYGNMMIKGEETSVEVYNNIASNNAQGPIQKSYTAGENNSWQRNEKIELNTNPNSSDFLKPKKSLDIGAFTD